MATSTKGLIIVAIAAIAAVAVKPLREMIEKGVDKGKEAIKKTSDGATTG